MEISVDTFLKKNPRATSETVGRTTLCVEEKAFLELAEMEQTLQDSASRELTVPAAEGAIDIDAPRALGALQDPMVRVFLDRESQAGHFHLVAKRAQDQALVYTEPTMIRLVAM